MSKLLNIKPDKSGCYITLTDYGREILAEQKRWHPEYLDHDLFAELVTQDDELRKNGWELFNPSEHGLTDSKVGLMCHRMQCEDDARGAYLYWHERYAVEDAIKVLKHRGLFLMFAGREDT